VTLPPRRREGTKPHNGFFRAFPLTKWCEHPAGPPRALMRTNPFMAVNQVHFKATVEQLAGNGQTCNTGTYDSDVAHGYTFCQLW
jgi:hypothetical protein